MNISESIRIIPGSIFTYQIAVRYIINQIQKKRSLKSVIKKQIFIGKSKFNTDIYIPANKIPRGTILLVHGMAPMGKNDPRMIDFGYNLADCGYRTIIPQFDSIANFIFDSNDEKKISEVVQCIYNSKELSCSKKIGIMTASYSGTLSLMAASDKKTSECISSLFVMGSFLQISSIFEHLFEKNNGNDYGRFIAMKNYFLTNKMKNIKLSHAMDLSARVLSSGKGKTLLAKHINSMKSSDRKLFEMLTHEPQFRKDMILKNSTALKQLYTEFNIKDKIQNIKSSVVLLHGSSDPVVPSSQSLLLGEKLCSSNIENRVLITPLITHANPQFGISSIVDILKLVHLLRFFFNRINTY